MPPKPPKEAIEACVGHTDGDKCSFKGFNSDTVSGICRQMRTEMSCMPDRPKGGGTPPEKPENVN